MSKLINVENNVAKFTMNIEEAEFKAGVDKAYKKLRKKINIPGFRKGKAPKKIIELNYGKEIFYDEAINESFPSVYKKSIEALNLDPVAQPAIEDVKGLEEGKDIELTISVVVKPDVKLGEYKGLKVEKTKVEVKEEQINAELQKMQEQSSRLVTVEDRAIKTDDIAVIDFEGFVDGVAFEGGKGENHNLTIGSNSFIPGFEEQLIGKNSGEEVEVNVTFPEEYHAENLKGKEAVFKVKINEIKFKEMPELDDEFAKDVSEFDSLEELKNDIKTKLEEDAKKAEEKEDKNKVIDLVCENAEVEIPKEMVETEVNGMLRDFDMQLRYQGLDLDNYLKFTNSTIDALKEQMSEDASKRVKTNLVLEAISKEENVEVSENDMEEYLVEMSKMYNMELDKLKETIKDTDKDGMKDSLLIRKTIDLVFESAQLS
ncbi:trigger factor [Peptostreptococcaceae bacterium AGR-M142]